MIEKPQQHAKEEQKHETKRAHRIDDHDNTNGIDMVTGGVWSRPGFLIRRLHQIHYAMFLEECKEGGITPVQYGILTVLAHEPWLDQTEIAYEVGLDRTTAADVIRRLEEKGLVERRVNRLDRRARQAAVTQKGLDMMDELQDSMARSQRRLLQPLRQRDQKIFMSLLLELVEANNQYGRAPLKAL